MSQSPDRSEVNPLEAVDNIKRIFSCATNGHDGTMTRDELHNAFSELGGWDTEMFNQLWERADKNKDGRMHFEEFVDWIMFGEVRRKISNALNVTLRRPSVSSVVSYGEEVILENQCGSLQWLHRDSYRVRFTCDPSSIVDKTAVWKIRNTSREGSGAVQYAEPVVLENQFDDLFMLESSFATPSFTTDGDRITNHAAVWKIHLAPSDTTHWNGTARSSPEEPLKYGDEVVLENDCDKLLLERSHKPILTCDNSCITSRTAVFKVIPVHVASD